MYKACTKDNYFKILLDTVNIKLRFFKFENMVKTRKYYGNKSRNL